MLLKNFAILQIFYLADFIEIARLSFVRASSEIKAVDLERKRKEHIILTFIISET